MIKKKNEVLKCDNLISWRAFSAKHSKFDIQIVFQSENTKSFFGSLRNSMNNLSFHHNTKTQFYNLLQKHTFNWLRSIFYHLNKISDLPILVTPDPVLSSCLYVGIRFSKTKLYFLNFYTFKCHLESSIKFSFHYSLYPLRNYFYIIVAIKAKFGLIYKNCTIATKLTLEICTWDQFLEEKKMTLNNSIIFVRV